MKKFARRYLSSILMTVLVIALLSVTACGSKEASGVKDGVASAEVEEQSARTEDQDQESYGPFSKEQIDGMRRQLHIPDDVETEVRIAEEPSYWEGAGIYTILCEFYSGDKLVAYADVNQDTGEPARNIMSYTP